MCMSRTIKRKKTGAKAFSHRCRNNGSCDYCKENRVFFDTKNRIAAENDIKNEVGELNNSNPHANDEDSVVTYDGEL